MFYCDACAKKNEWPETIFRSRGACEMCGALASCNDVPSKYLPDAKRSDPAAPKLELVEVPEVQWTNKRLTQKSTLTDHLKARFEEYENGSWVVWDWGDEAEEIMRILGLLDGSIQE